MDIAAFIGCTPAAISFAMKKNGVKKGIIRNTWRVEAFDPTGKL
jgi:hypothetical protein